MLKFTTFITVTIAVCAMAAMLVLDKPVYGMLLLVASAFAGVYLLALLEEENSIYS